MKKQLINEVYRMQQIAGIKPLYEGLNEDEGQSVYTVQGSDDIGDIWTVCFKDKATYDTKQQAAENMLKDKHDLEELYLTTEVGTEDNNLTSKQKETLDKLGFVPTKVSHGKTVSNLEEDDDSGSVDQVDDDTEQSVEDTNADIQEGGDIDTNTVNFDNKYSEDKFNRFVAAARSLAGELEDKGGSMGNIITYLRDVVKDTAMPPLNEVDMDTNTNDDRDDSLQKVIAYDKDDEDSEDAPEETDTWYAVSDDSFDNDKEPTGKDIKTTAGVDTSKQGKLIALQGKKDDVLAKLKSGQITIDQYKQEIGNIPQQIKNLQAAIEAELNVNDDEEEY